MYEGVKGEPDVFAVIAHPLRRALLDRLREGGGAEQPVKRLAAPFAVSRPAVSQHLSVLLAAGLVRERKVGRERHYRLAAGGLRAVSEWAGRYEQFWEESLERLGRYLDEIGGDGGGAPPAPSASPADPGGEGTGGRAGGA